MLRPSITLVWLVGIASPAISEAQGESEANTKAFQAFAAANQQLRTAMAAYRDRLTDEQQLLFDQAHAAWVQYRQAACEFQSSGTANTPNHTMTIFKCFENITRIQLENIRTLANCQERDLGCPPRKGDI